MKNAAALLMLVIIVFVPLLSAQQIHANSQEAVLVLLEKGSKGTIYRVDGKDVTANPLRGLADVYEKHGAKADYPVFAVVDDRLPIRMLGEASGLIGKVGFSNVRYFRFAADVGKVGEISFGRVFPFS